MAAAMFGRISEQLRDETAEITVKPFDNWGLMGTLFPVYVGATTAAGAAALLIGKRPHAESAPFGDTKVWTPDGRLYDAVRTAIVGHPSLHLGVAKALYGDVRILAIGDLTKVPGASGYLFANNAITESGAGDPGGQMTLADFVREAWNGVWSGGTGVTPAPGFGAAAGSLGGTAPIQAEEEWTIETAIKYSQLKVQGRTLAAKLDSCAFMARCRPFGPSHTDILAAIGQHSHGQRLGSGDLALTGQLSGKLITLKNAEVRGAGFEFGGTTLGTGEVGFVNTMQFSGGVPGPLIVFSS